jgi:hypothetical protein
LKGVAAVVDEKWTVERCGRSGGWEAKR